MSSGDYLDGHQTYARYVKATHVGSYAGLSYVDGAALKLRFRDGELEPGLSGHHPEYFGCVNLLENMAALVRHVRDNGRLVIKQNGAYGVAKVDDIKDAGKSVRRGLEVQKDPLPPEGRFKADPAHVVLVGLRMEDDLLQAKIGRMMAVHVVREM